MARTLMLSLLVAALVAGVYVASGKVRNLYPQAPLIQQESQSEAAVAATNFATAATVLQSWFAANGTYVGAALPDATGVTLARAGATSYCLETSDNAVLHELGPGGTPQPGPC